MKRPVVKQKVRIKSGDNVFEEDCIESYPDRAKGELGWKFTILTTRQYISRPITQYWLVGDDGEELGATVDSVEKSVPRSDMARVTFSTYFPNPQ